MANAELTVEKLETGTWVTNRMGLGPEAGGIVPLELELPVDPPVDPLEVDEDVELPLDPPVDPLDVEVDVELEELELLVGHGPTPGWQRWRSPVMEAEAEVSAPQPPAPITTPRTRVGATIWRYRKSSIMWVPSLPP